MEKNLEDFLNLLDKDVKEYSPLALAYIGDSIYESIVRSIVVGKEHKSIKDLHNISIKYSNAAFQSKVVDIIKDILTEEEVSIYKKARNSNKSSLAKNQSAKDYRRATGLEALIGYLFISKNYKRLEELINYILEVLHDNIWQESN